MSQLAAMMNAALEEERNAPAAPADSGVEDAPSTAADAVASPDGAGAESPTTSEAGGAPSPPDPAAPAVAKPAEGAAADAEKQKAEAAAKAQREAAQFAALARAKEANVRASQELAAREKAAADREAALAQREAEAHRIIDDPELLFRHIEQRWGVKTVEDMRVLAAGKWKRPEPELPPEKRPLTKADLEAERQKWQQEEANRQAIASFSALFEGERFEAASLLYTPQERIAIGDRLGRELGAQGVKFTLEELADAVDEKARQDPRYAKLQSRLAPASAAGKAPAPTASPAGRQPNQAATAPSNAAATERTSANGTPRLSHRERVREMLRRG